MNWEDDKVMMIFFGAFVAFMIYYVVRRRFTQSGSSHDGFNDDGGSRDSWDSGDSGGSHGGGGDGSD